MATPSEHERSIEKVRGWIEEARYVLALTGAGISTDSGIADFRGPQGLWTKNPAAEKMATLQHYVSDSEVRKRAWKSRLDSAAWQAKPNPGHAALVTLAARGKLDMLITQNVDGLHQAAGMPADQVVEIHGTMREVACLECDDRAPMERALERVREGEEDPSCRSCGGILKSATISFGQSLIQADLQRSEEAAHACDLLLAIGSTLAVGPINMVVPIAKQSGARIVILNAEATEMDELADVIFRDQISAVLPKLAEPGD